MTSGPRFALVFLQYYLQSQASKSPWPFILLIVGIIRSLSCGGWVYITSTDHHDAHDVLMVFYIICNVPWMFGSISYTPSMRLVTKRQRYVVDHVSRSRLHPHRPGNTSQQRSSARLRIRPQILMAYLRFFVSIVPMVYFFIQHKIHKRPGGECIRGVRSILKPHSTPFSLYDIQFL